MYMYDLLLKKRNNHPLSEEEITFMIDEYVKGTIPDYQMSAMLMAIYFNGMTKDEIYYLTKAMTKSGDIVDLSAIDGIKVDKHSTGGVGDKTTLIISPIVASYGVKVAKMSGRGLGHTGGTIDKLESIPGFRTVLSREEFFNQVNNIGFSVIGQSGNIAPADKKIYALRDVTATVESIPLIASSIMSKKLASGSDTILLDVKMGSGAFMKDIDTAIDLAKSMVDIGEKAGKKTVALITNMDIPLGRNIGNSLEVIESVEVLHGKGAKDLTDVCVELAGNMLYLAGKADIKTCLQMAKDAIKNSQGLEYLKKMVKAQGADPKYIENKDLFEKASISYDIISEEEGYIDAMDTENIGSLSTHLGAGRLTKDDKIDYSAGIILHKKRGDKVSKSDVLATVYTNDKSRLDNIDKKYKKCLTISNIAPPPTKLIYARVEKDKVTKY